MTTRAALGLALAALVAIAGCSKPSYEVALEDASNVAVDSPVYVAGVAVGKVTQVRVQGARAHATFQIQGDHEVSFHEDACAIASRDPAHRGLWIVAGEEDDDLEGPIPECHVTAPMLERIGRTLGRGFGELGRGFFEGVGTVPVLPPVPTLPQGAGMPQLPAMPPMPPMPSLPGMPGMPGVPGQNAAAICAAIRIRVEATEPVPPQPLILPEGGTRVRLVIENDNDVVVTTGTRTSGRFMTEGRRVVEVANVVDPSVWMFPLTIPAHGSVSTSVVLAAKPETGAFHVEAVEIGDVHPENDPFARCTASAVDLPAPAP